MYQIGGKTEPRIRYEVVADDGWECTKKRKPDADFTARYIAHTHQTNVVVYAMRGSYLVGFWHAWPEKKQA